jgi:hypothetical protein
MSEGATMLTPRWIPLAYHAVQAKVWTCNARFEVDVAGRRSGKTELAKRKLIRRALRFTSHHNGKFIFSAPVRDQAKKIYWDDLKEMIPPRFVADFLETELTAKLITGTRIQVIGMDKPQRAEGEPIDGIVLDEYADMKETVWKRSVRPALSTKGRPGWAMFIGKPKGRNHFYRLYKKASSLTDPNWAAFHWKSSEVIDPEEDEAARRELDPLTYSQEYDADFINFEGRIYYPFESPLHANERLPYFDDQPLLFAFDFNRKPGTASVHQEQRYWGTNPKVSGEITSSIGEVWIPDNSNTERVCAKLIAEWGKHKGHVYCYGDPSGGQKGSAKVAGSDWELIEQALRPVFKERLHFRVDKADPGQRVRINALNRRLLNTDGKVRWLIDPSKCPHIVEDLEGVVALEGGSGEIDKDKDEWLSHLSDGMCYLAARKYPLVVHTMTAEPLAM